MARRVNDEALALIKRWEGLKTEAYLDVANVWTIGYGHTRTAKAGMVITEAEAEQLLRQDLREAETAVERLVQVDLTDGQFGALVSFVFNVGQGALASSTLLRKLNRGDYASVPSELVKWNKARVNGKLQPVKGLSNRRAAEVGLWARGSFVAGREVETVTPPAPPRPEVQAAGYATAVATAAPALQALSGLDPLVVGLIVGAIALAIIALLVTQRRRKESP
jgi:lysozyme